MLNTNGLGKGLSLGNQGGLNGLNTDGGGLGSTEFQTNITTEMHTSINVSVIGYISDKLSALTNFVPKSEFASILSTCNKPDGTETDSLNVKGEKVLKKKAQVTVTLNKEKPTEQMARSFCYDAYMQVYNNNFKADEADKREKYIVVSLQNTSVSDLKIGSVAETVVQGNRQIAILTKDQFIELRQVLGKQFAGGMDLTCEGAVIGKVTLGYKSKTAGLNKDANSTKWVAIKYIDRQTNKTHAHMIDVSDSIPHFALTSYIDNSTTIDQAKIDKDSLEYLNTVTGKVTGLRKRFTKATFDNNDAMYKKAKESEKIPFDVNKKACELLNITEAVYKQIQTSKATGGSKSKSANEAIEQDKEILAFFNENR